MLQWKPLPSLVTVVLAILAGLFLQHQYSGALANARAETQAARKEAVAAASVTRAALDYADSATARADSAEAKAVRQIAAARRPLPQLPDTCAPALVALAQADSAFASEHQAAQELRQAADTVVAVAGPLVAATEHLSDAAGTLVKASRPSFFARIAPDVGIGAAVGIDPETRRFSKTVGLTLSWRI